MKHLEQLLIEASQFSLEKRVAAALHLEGVTFEGLNEIFKQRPFTLFSDPLKLKILNELRDIDTGFTKITPRLEELARRLISEVK